MTDRPSDDDTSEAALRSVDDAALRAAFVRLPANCRCLLEALYFRGEEVSYVDVSADLDIPVGSIGPTRARCLNRLRRLLEELDGAGASTASARGSQ